VIDYSALGAAMAVAEQTIRRTRHTLAVLRSEGSHLSEEVRRLGQAAKPDAEGPVSILALFHCWVHHKASKV
jgi:hypothetical protein